MRIRRDIQCPKGKTRALAIGQAVEELERDGGGEIAVHDSIDPDLIVLTIAVEVEVVT